MCTQGQLGWPFEHKTGGTRVVIRGRVAVDFDLGKAMEKVCSRRAQEGGQRPPFLHSRMEYAEMAYWQCYGDTAGGSEAQFVIHRRNDLDQVALASWSASKRKDQHKHNFHPEQ